MHPLAATLSIARDTSATALLQAASSSASNASELVSYLDCDTVSQLDDDFNLLNWWHEHKLTYPVLSIMAKDILTVPVSTISLESTFSMTSRIIEERRRKLKPEMVEMLTCIKDWETTEARLQHMVEDKELGEAFEDLDGELIPIEGADIDSIERLYSKYFSKTEVWLHPLLLRSRPKILRMTFRNRPFLCSWIFGRNGVVLAK